MISVFMRNSMREAWRHNSLEACWPVSPTTPILQAARYATRYLLITCPHLSTAPCTRPQGLYLGCARATRQRIYECIMYAIMSWKNACSIALMKEFRRHMFLQWYNTALLYILFSCCLCIHAGCLRIKLQSLGLLNRYKPVVAGVDFVAQRLYDDRPHWQQVNSTKSWGNTWKTAYKPVVLCKCDEPLSGKPRRAVSHIPWKTHAKGTKIICIFIV
jgi:hypothetical protein